jgi:hypothetical protein
MKTMTNTEMTIGSRTDQLSPNVFAWIERTLPESDLLTQAVEAGLRWNWCQIVLPTDLAYRKLHAAVQLWAGIEDEEGDPRTARMLYGLDARLTAARLWGAA